MSCLLLFYRLPFVTADCDMIPKQLWGIFEKSYILSDNIKSIAMRPDIVAAVTRGLYTLVANEFILRLECVRYCNGKAYTRKEGIDMT